MAFFSMPMMHIPSLFLYEILLYGCQLSPYYA